MCSDQDSLIEDGNIYLALMRNVALVQFVG